ncbi:hypothetical protein [Thalassotalea agariperforans]
MSFKQLQLLSLVKLVLFFTVVTSTLVKAESDEILSLSSQEIIGLEEMPVIHIELNVDKTRDLYVALQNLETRQPVKNTMKRIRKSGKYHFDFPLENIKPGKYRWNAYLAPRGKNWNDRIGQTVSQDVTIIAEPKYVKKVKFGKQDRIKSVNWPKQITDNKEQLLAIKFDVTEPRDLHIKLLSSVNWEEFGAIKYTISKPQDINIPFNDMLDNFEAGKYAWVVYLTEVDGTESILPKKFGKHFEIIK